MIIVQLKEGDNIEKALKKYKRKTDRIGVIRKLRTMQAFHKPSEIKRRQMEKARYVQGLRQQEL